MPFSVRCSYSQMVSVDEIREHPKNPNTHSDKQLRFIGEILQFQGWREPLVVSERSGCLVSGHGRLAAARADGEEEVPVDFQEFTEEEELAHLVSDNEIARLAEMEAGKLSTLIAGLRERGVDLSVLAFTERRFDTLLQSVVDRSPLAESLEKRRGGGPDVKLGERWILGDHVLLCGDAADENNYRRLFGDVKPFLMVTDPPYGVEYDPAWREQAKVTGQVLNDDQASWCDVYELFEDDVAYVWHAAMFVDVVFRDLLNAGFKRDKAGAQIVVWVKENFAIGRGCYHWHHEACWFVSRGPVKWQGGRTQSTWWDIPMGDENSEEEKKTGHGTQKPLECMARPIRNHGGREDVVYDPFLGSGTTLIAAEKLGRVCYGMELSEDYCSDIIGRWERVTGRKAIRDDGAD